MSLLDLLFRRTRRFKQKLTEDPVTQKLVKTIRTVNKSKPAYSDEQLDHLNFLCIDLEFSDLNSKKGDILSIGWVEVNEGRLSLRSCKLLNVKNRETVGHSATIHHILDTEAESGMPLKQAILELLKACEGKVLVFHHSKLDLEYLNQACKRICGEKLNVAVYDTMAHEQKTILKTQPVIPPGALTLKACRTRHKLPDYPEHNALVDAIATGELFLAQISTKN